MRSKLYDKTDDDFYMKSISFYDIFLLPETHLGSHKWIILLSYLQTNVTL